MRSRPGIGARVRSPACLTKDAEHPAHVGQRLSAGSVDGNERCPGLLGSPVKGGQPGPGLDHDHAHMMGHDVVEFAGDPLALVLDGPKGPALAIGFQETGVLLDRLRVVAPRPGPVAQRDDDDDRKRRLDGPCHRHLGAGLADDDREERGTNGQPGDDGHAPVVQLGDGEQRDERPQALVDDKSLDVCGMQAGRRQRDDEDRDRPAAPDDQRQRLEEQKGDAERVALTGIGRAARERDQRKRG